MTALSVIAQLACFAATFFLGARYGRQALLDEQSREADAMWGTVKAEIHGDDEALAELCALLGPYEVPERARSVEET